MTPNKLINNGTGKTETIRSQVKMDVVINGVIYTAVTDRDYSLSVTVPTQIAEDGFEYSDHAIVQPMSFDFTVVVSKIELGEYQSLLDLFANKTVFSVESLPFTRSRCIITDMRVTDNMFDSLTVKLTIAEIIFSYLYTISSTDARFQLFDAGSKGNTASAIMANSTDAVKSPGTINETAVLGQLSNTKNTVSLLTNNVFTGTSLAAIAVSCPPLGTALVAAGIAANAIFGAFDKSNSSNTKNEQYDNMRASQFTSVKQ